MKAKRSHYLSSKHVHQKMVAEEHVSLRISVLCMALPIMAILALSFPIFLATGEGYNSRELQKHSLLLSAFSSNRYSSAESFYSLSSYSQNGVEVYCTSETPYTQQPAQCQQAEDTHRIAVFLPIGISTLAGLLAALLALRMFGNTGSER